MPYTPRVFPDELYISILNRLDRLDGTHWNTQKYRAKPKYQFDSSSTLKQLHAKLKLDSDLLVEKFNWAHTFYPALYYRKCNKPSNPNKTKSVSKYLGMMCPDCIRDDIKVHGVAYVHRSHNFPQVRFCHIHSTKLEETCSSCGLRHILHTASDYYDCNHQLTNKPNDHEVINIVELEHAKFIYELLNSIKTPIKSGSITQASLNRAIELGLNQRLFFDLKAVETYAAAMLNGTLLTLDLSSYPILSSKTSWDLFYTTLFVLFKDASCFLEYVTTCQSKIFISQPYAELHENRLRLQNILLNSNYNNHNELLNDHLELIQWLKKNDPFQTSHKLTKYNLGSDQRDKEAADEIDKISKRLYSEKGIPVRITAKRIAKELNIRKLRQTKKQGRPSKSAKKLKEIVESTHHYYIRVILWAAPALGARERTITKLKSITGISKTRLQPVAEYFGWLEAGCLIINLPRDISELSIPVTWTLPVTLKTVLSARLIGPGIEQGLAGRLKDANRRE